MEKKYYTPDLEDLHLGYFCEWNNPNEDNLWRLTNLDRVDIYSYIEDVQNNLIYTKLRTPYLSKEEIESLGFTKINGYSHPFLGQTVEAFGKKVGGGGFNDGGRFIIVKHPQSEAIEIHVEYESSWAGVKEQLFSGEAKSINELKKILKWLKIK